MHKTFCKLIMAGLLIVFITVLGLCLWKRDTYEQGEDMYMKNIEKLNQELQREFMEKHFVKGEFEFLNSCFYLRKQFAKKTKEQKGKTKGALSFCSF